MDSPIAPRPRSPIARVLGTALALGLLGAAAFVFLREPAPAPAPVAPPAPDASTPAAPPEPAPVAAVEEPPVQPPVLTEGREPKTRYEFVALPGGTFLMGCVDGDPACKPDEKPPREVVVKPFSLGRKHVLAIQYAQCAMDGTCDDQPMADPNPACNGVGQRKVHPMNCLTWKDAATFCRWIGARLPTAEELEWAAKGGEARLYPWGNEPPDATRAQYDDKEGTSEWDVHPKGASKHDVLDLAGNVWQWTSTRADAKNYEIRGGAWNSEAVDLRASNRDRDEPGYRYTTIGARCAFSTP